VSAPVPMPDAIRETLEKRLGPVFFSDIRAHLERAGLFVVRADLDLIECGVAVATDDVEQVSAWIEEKKLRRPSTDELTTWASEPGRRWMAIVVQPFVLVQDAPAADADEAPADA